MKIQTKLKIVAAVSVMTVFFACNNSPYPGYETSESGLYFKFYNHDENGVKPKEGDIVRLVLQYKNNKDSVIYDSKNPQINRSGTDFIEFPLGPSTFKGSFEDALVMMSVGDSGSFIISADSVYLKTFGAPQLPAYIEKGSMLTFEAKLEKITSKEEAEQQMKKKREEQQVMMELRKNEEPKVFARYLEDNKVIVKPTASGLYYVETVKGKGPKPTNGATVKVNYTGRLLDGTVFDTSDEATAKQAGLYNAQRPYQPIEFPLGAGQVIPGWDEGIALMSKGAKGKLIIPSSLAYGERGGGPIPPYSPLVFEVELVSFSAGEASPQMNVIEKDHK